MSIWSLSIAWRAVRATMLGALTTIAVAWTFTRQETYEARFTFGAAWDLRVSDGGQRTRLYLLEHRLPGAVYWNVDTQGVSADEPELTPHASVPSDVRDLLLPWPDGGSPLPAERYHVLVAGFGWPLPALGCSGVFQGTDARLDRGIIEIPHLETATTVPRLPIRIFPLGFAADTALAAGAWSLLPFAVKAALRVPERMRRRRGLCVSCKYDLRGLTFGAPCPECGTPTPSAPAAPAPNS